MSSIRLLRDYNGQHPPAIISVPFHVGKQLLADGIGVYPDPDEVKGIRPGVFTTQVSAADIGKGRQPGIKASDGEDDSTPGFGHALPSQKPDASKQLPAVSHPTVHPPAHTVPPPEKPKGK